MYHWYIYESILKRLSSKFSGKLLESTGNHDKKRWIKNEPVCKKWKEVENLSSFVIRNKVNNECKHQEVVHYLLYKGLKDLLYAGKKPLFKYKGLHNVSKLKNLSGAVDK